MKKYKIVNKKRFCIAVLTVSALALSIGVGLGVACAVEPACAAPVTTEGEPVPTLAATELAEPKEPTYTQEELEALALVIYQEAGGDSCSDDCRQMVGEVVLNRVADSRFPGTIEEVLLQPKQYGRLSKTGLVWPERASNPEEAHAIERAYKCAEQLLSGSTARLLPPDVIFQAEFVQGEIVAELDGFYFCRK